MTNSTEDLKVSAVPLPVPARSAPLLANVQLLRAIAALAVVFRHATSTAGLSLPYSVGRFGVDVFFVISGFIIAYVTHYNSRRFLTKRLLRIVPFYWSATIALFLIALVLPKLLHNTQADATLLVTSLFFIPYQGPDGATPLLMLGWSLNFEMYFYVLFWASLFVSRKWASLICAGLVALLFIAANAVLDRSGAARYYFGNSTMFEFIFGIAAFHLFDRLSLRGAPKLIRTLLAVVSAAAIVTLVAQEMLTGGITDRLVTAGIAAVCLVTSCIFLERDFGWAVSGPFALLLGEASYTLYLIHPYVIYSILRLGFHHAETWSEPARWMLVAPLLAAATGCAILAHLYYEKPLLRLLKRALLPGNGGEEALFPPSPVNAEKT